MTVASLLSSNGGGNIKDKRLTYLHMIKHRPGALRCNWKSGTRPHSNNALKIILHLKFYIK